MQRSIINLSVPKEMEKQIISMAKEESKSKSELLREAFRVYQLRKKWAKIRSVGEETARRMGIETYDEVEK
jgi:metal-responsive CopG/Arc/MetJ family transcriptional regulator